jgi:glutathione S-transferase
VEKFKLPYKIVDKTTIDNYTTKFPLGKIPAIEEESGFKLTESAAVTLYCK